MFDNIDRSGQKLHAKSMEESVLKKKFMKIKYNN